MLGFSQGSTEQGRALTNAQKTVNSKPILISKDPGAYPIPEAGPALNKAHGKETWEYPSSI